MSERRKVLIAGGGVAALETAVGLHDSLNVEVEVTLITPSRDFHYRPFAALEPFGIHGFMRMPIADLLAGCNVEIIYDTVSQVDLESKQVTIAAGAPVGYDALLVSIGAQQVPGVRGATTVGGPDGNDRMIQMLHEIDAGVVGNVTFVVPAGASWTLPAYEFALLTSLRARRRLHGELKIQLVTPERQPLAVFGPGATKHVQDLLAKDGIELHASEQAIAFVDGVLTTKSGRSFASDRVIALPHLAGQRIPGLPSDADGFLAVDAHCRVTGTEDLYAAGDITDFPIKQGSIAAQQADAVIASLATRFGSQQTAEPFKPQLHAILFSDRGRTFMQAASRSDPPGAAVSEQPLWENAEKIFSRHLSTRMRRVRAAQLKGADG
jgi:sulfide:quinone oxidoreductase